jgi:thiosulfate/3-mercaptopyruvate sulfurtransferase
MTALLANGAAQFADARGPGRFSGTQPEPLPGLRSGHMPGARNVPYTMLLNADGTQKSAGELREAFKTRGIDPTKPVVTTCGSGITAAILSLGLALAGQPDSGLYDGSWSEWGQDNGLPVDTGAA